ncbi:MAG: FAD-dependent oxidoreductase [Verrucomicrobiaceae bacterium]|nr:MAG: FAD-dependent oxidoreductase [Verrucomicrobiaceae bacterium]
MPEVIFWHRGNAELVSRHNTLGLASVAAAVKNAVPSERASGPAPIPFFNPDMTAPTSDSSPQAPWDVIIIGGGPAGSTAATTLAKAGRRVLVLEKEKFPRFHIGESLLPYNREIFDRLGVWPKIEAAGFMVKRGAQFLMGNGSHRNRLNFSKGAFTEFPESIQVERSKFDDLLLKHSMECGADVREEALVLSHRVQADSVTVKYRSGDGAEHTVSAAFLMDASGLSNLTANQASLREYYPGHKKLAIFGHFSGVDMPQGDQYGDILVVRRENSWFWLIPLEADKTSVGLVLDQKEFQALGGKPDAIFHEAARTTKVVAERFTAAVSLEPLRVLTDFSYRNGRLIAPRVVRIGDASGFIDPVFSSGVMLAMTSGHQGAEAVGEALASGSPMTAGMRRYEKDTRRRIAQYWEFIENFYKNSFAQLFFQPYNRLSMVCAINAVLAGRTRLPLVLRLRLRIFFFLAWLNRHVPVARRIEIS